MVLAADVLHGIANLVHDAQLDVCLWKYALDGIRETSETINASYQDVLHAAVLKVGKNAQPKDCSWRWIRIRDTNLLACLVFASQRMGINKVYIFSCLGNS